MKTKIRELKIKNFWSKRAFTCEKSFTLAEIIIAIGVLAVVTTAGTVSFFGYKNRRSFDLDAETVVEAVRNAQNRAIFRESGTQWGVKFIREVSGLSTFEIFSGPSHTTSSVVLKKQLSNASSFSNPSSGYAKSIVFNTISGTPMSINSVVIKRSIGSDLYTISVSPNGRITKTLEQSMVGMWSFDEGSGASAYDASGRGNTGTLTNSPTWQLGSNCRAGGCLSFNGINNYVQLGASQSYASAVTVSAWVFHNAASDWDDIIAGGCGNVLFGFSNNYLSFGGQCNNPFNPIVYASNINGAWRHVAGVYNGSVAVLYVDGNAVASSTRSGSFSVFTPRIGGEGATENFDGRIDDVRIYNRALSATEIKNIYESY